jgi:hypothetical protein
MMKSFALVVVGALVGAAVFGVQPPARAQSAVTTAYFGGLQSQPAFVPQIFVFNTTGGTQTLDLVLRAPDGTVLVTHPAAMTVGPFATGVLNLTTELAHAGPKLRAYRGVFTAVLSGDATSFTDTTCVVHAVQYFGSIKSPRGACVVRPLISTPPI